MTRSPPTRAGARRCGCPVSRASWPGVPCSTRPTTTWPPRSIPRSACYDRVTAIRPWEADRLMTADGSLRIGVVLEAFLDWPLDQIMPWLREHAPDVTDLEIGAGGYAPHPHCDVEGLLASDQARSAWQDGIARHWLRIDALNAWGNPLHPDQDLAREHDRALRDAIRLAALLGVSRVVALAGCPGGAPGDQVPHFGAGGWLPYLEGVYQRQWEEQIAPYWSGLADFAAAQSRDLRVCLELHPGTCVFNVETFGRVAALGPSLAANLDPSHFFWMGMDGHKVAAALGDRIGHVHGKDTVFHEEHLALNGLLDRRWPEPAAEMPWTFAVPGRGHDQAWWTGLVPARWAPRRRRSSPSSTRIRSFRPPPACPRPPGCCGRRSTRPLFLVRAQRSVRDPPAGIPPGLQLGHQVLEGSQVLADPGEPDRDDPLGQFALRRMLVDQRAALLVREGDRVQGPDQAAPGVLVG